jgi:hypothetical protein
MMASTSPRLITAGVTPARANICVMRLCESAARYLQNHTTRAPLMASMNMANVSWNNDGFMVETSILGYDRLARSMTVMPWRR